MIHRWVHADERPLDAAIHTVNFTPQTHRLRRGGDHLRDKSETETCKPPNEVFTNRGDEPVSSDYSSVIAR